MPASGKDEQNYQCVPSWNLISSAFRPLEFKLKLIFTKGYLNSCELLLAQFLGLSFTAGANLAVGSASSTYRTYQGAGDLNARSVQN